ncbi:DUF1707 domain-containing protein [Mycobacterium sp. NPDC050041]|uniref:DUF1707 domain-containing protein n=1 Tax=Mycobacterium sp. NPDC050041 TaxID=3364293 RepID=UPI003C2DA6FE
MTAPDTTSTRAGDREREKTASDLGLALAQGYLDMTDYEQRVQSAFAAGTRDELRALTADLPVANLRRNDPRRRDAHARAARRGAAVHLAAYIAGSLLMLGIWLAVGLTGGGWYFWPVWPIMGWGIGVVSHTLSARSGSPCGTMRR